MKRKLIISTSNQNKVKEIKNILEDLDIEVISKADMGLGDLEVVEDGETLEENSLKKAHALAERLNHMVLADDSGIFVDALEGKPGVHSSRYAGEEGNDLKNNKKFLRELENVPEEKRDAKFKTIIVLITESKKEIIVYGECRGKIGFKELGKNGFGYDPLFIPDGYDVTFGQIEDKEKNKISHRAQALENLKKEILKLIKDEKN